MSPWIGNSKIEIFMDFTFDPNFFSAKTLVQIGHFKTFDNILAKKEKFTTILEEKRREDYLYAI
jgi:hypothetical protein